MVVLRCPSCDASFSVSETVAAKGRRYCSISCGNRARRGPSHPRHDQNAYRPLIAGKQKYIYQVKAAQVLGRPLRKHEVVHHLNHNRRDNRNCNWVICTDAYHKWLHYRLQPDHFQKGLAVRWTRNQRPPTTPQEEP